MANRIMDSRMVKWSQWDNSGMIRCGETDYGTVMGWMQELGLDAKRCVMAQDKPHAIYGRKMHDDTGRITEIRMYCNAYLDDAELDTVAYCNPLDTLYVAHK